MTSTTTEERGLCAVCLRSVAVCDGQTCQYDPSTAEVRPRMSSFSTPLRPTDRQFALAAEVLETCDLFVPSHRLRDECEAAQEAVKAWLLSVAAPGSHERLLEDIDSCRACGAPLKLIGGNMVCPACAGSARVRALGPGATTTVATMGTSPTVDGHWTDTASKAASIAAGAAARDAIAAGADPLLVVDAALVQIARHRELTGLSGAYVARDPLAQLVSELRHKRVPSQFARVVGAMAKASEHDAALEGGYEDGHERRVGDWSLLELLDLVPLATFEGTREELTEKAIDEARRIAGMLVDWRGAIADNQAGADGYDPSDPKIRAEIESAADEFIAGLTKAGAP